MEKSDNLVIFVIEDETNKYIDMIKEKIEEFVNDILYNPGNKKLICDTLCYNPNTGGNHLLLKCDDYSVFTYCSNGIDFKVETFGGYELTQDDKDRIKGIKDNHRQLWRIVSRCYDMENNPNWVGGMSDTVVGSKMENE